MAKCKCAKPNFKYAGATKGQRFYICVICDTIYTDAEYKEVLVQRGILPKRSS